MRKKKLLTIDDLVKFCQDQNFTQFSSKDSGYSIHVQVPCENFEFVDNEDPLTFYGNVKLMHTGKNRNHSTLTEKAAKNCLSKIAYKPVLADFTEVNGERDFTYHAMEFNEDGSRTYIEKQVGCFTSDKPYMKQDPDHKDRQYIYAKVAIPREYTDAAEIIERKGGTKVSAELCINEMSYSVDDGLLLEDVDVMAVTLLGTDPDTGEPVQEGMENAFLQIEDFSADNNSIINKAQLKDEIIAEIMSRLDYKKAFAENSKEGGKPKEMDKFNELLEKYNKTVDDITFDYNDMSDEELEVAFADAFEIADSSEDSSSEENEKTAEEEANTVLESEATGETTDTDNEPAENSGTEEFADEDPAIDGGGSDEGGGDDPTHSEPTEEEQAEEDEHQSISAIEDEDSTGTRVENSLNYSVTINGIKKEFAVSLADKINAITTLVNDTYSESDNTWYYCDVFEDDGRYCVMHDFWGDRHYRQEYSVKKDVYSLKGDRVQVYAQYLTSDEIAKLDKMKADFSSIESELNAYKSKELHSQREEILASEDYSVMVDFEDFKELKSHMDEYSLEDLTNKADLIYAKFMKSNYSNFAAKEQPKKRSMVFMTSGDDNANERLPYGGLFKNFKTKK